MILALAIGLAVATPVMVYAKKKDHGILHIKFEKPSSLPLTIRNLSSEKLRIIRTEHDGIPPEETDVTIKPFETIATNLTVREKDKIVLAVEDEEFQVTWRPRSVEISPPKFVGVYHPARSHLAIARDTKLSSWMQKLPDETPLSAISIPGTHNSPTCYRALPSVRCQSASITQQLEHGIRFLDVRCQPKGCSDLILVHGAFPICVGGNKRFREVLDECYKFLDKNPSETIVMSLKREGRGNATDGEFARILRENFITKERWWSGPLPKLGEARGKIIPMRRFTDGAELGGIDADGWPFNTPNSTVVHGTLCIQDYCEVLKPDVIGDKIGYILDHLGRASASQEDSVAFINFLSAANFSRVSTWPEEIAKKVIPAVNEFLATRQRGNTGIVLSDFVGDNGDWMFCRLVVAMNERFK